MTSIDFTTTLHNGKGTTEKVSTAKVDATERRAAHVLQMAAVYFAKVTAPHGTEGFERCSATYTYKGSRGTQQCNLAADHDYGHNFLTAEKNA